MTDFTYIIWSEEADGARQRLLAGLTWHEAVDWVLSAAEPPVVIVTQGPGPDVLRRRLL